MVVFYAYTHLNIIECMNTRIHYYSKDKAYLIVRGSPTISFQIVDKVRQSKIFDEVFCVDMPIIDTRKLRWGRIKGLRTIEKMKVLYKFYDRYLNEYFNKEKCEVLLLVGGWNDAIFVAYYFAHKNSDLKIRFVEEGSLVYTKTRRELYEARWDPPGVKKTTKISRYIAEKKYIKKGLKNLEREIYISSVELYKKRNTDAEAIPLKLPCIDENNSKLYNVVRTLVQDNIYECQNHVYVDFDNLAIRYSRCKVVFLADYSIPESEQLGLLDRIIREVSEQYIIIKVHTADTAHKKNFASEYVEQHRGLYVDRNDYYFEALYTRLDFANKIFVSYGSTLMMYTKQMWGQEPFLIFTYKLYDDYLYHGDIDQIEDAVLFCKSTYSDPSKVMAPNSKYEFENMLKEAYLRSLE